jgi:hypothetical protein
VFQSEQSEPEPRNPFGSDRKSATRELIHGASTIQVYSVGLHVRHHCVERQQVMGDHLPFAALRTSAKQRRIHDLIVATMAASLARAKRIPFDLRVKAKG